MSALLKKRFLKIHLVFPFLSYSFGIETNNAFIHSRSSLHPSLRADEINLWLTPSAKQRRNPCSGLPVKKGLCFVCRDRQSG